MKTSCKLSLFSENDVAASGLDLASTSNIPYMPFDPASTEVVLDLGRALYKLMFQLLLLIESNHKISSNVVNHFRQNENVSTTPNVASFENQTFSNLKPNSSFFSRKGT